MGRRTSGNMNGEQYLGNTNNKEVHDLDREDTSSNGCQINEIIAAGHDQPFTMLAAGDAVSFDNCPKCLGGSTR